MKLSTLFRRTLDVPYLSLKENAASYFCERDGDILFLFFEKSNGAVDWRNNFDFPARPYREMEHVWFVHRGFMRVFKSIEPQIEPYVLDPDIRHIFVSGYSHGAALALLAHEYCAFHRPDLKHELRGYGFGCPRVVWGPLPDALRERFFRFTVVRNCRDLVTHLPPRLFGYRHVGALLRIGSGEGWGPIDSHRAETYFRSLEKGEFEA